MPLAFSPAGCCCGSCNVFSDSFTRADSSIPGANWIVPSGASWPIISNQLVAGSGILQCARSRSDGVPFITVTAVASGPSGARPRVIADLGGAQYYAEVLIPTSGSPGTLTLGSSAGVLNSTSVDLSAGPISITICTSPEGFVSATAGDQTIQADGTATTSTSGLSTSGAGPVDFTSYTVTKAGGDCPDCAPGSGSGSDCDPSLVCGWMIGYGAWTFAGAQAIGTFLGADDCGTDTFLLFPSGDATFIFRITASTIVTLTAVGSGPCQSFASAMIVGVCDVQSGGDTLPAGIDVVYLEECSDDELNTACQTKFGNGSATVHLMPGYYSLSVRWDGEYNSADTTRHGIAPSSWTFSIIGSSDC
jgi:hypothetical protein